MATRSKLADFEILSRLGAGSFGTVFKVKRYIDGNLYVIKNVRIVELSFKEQSEAINEVQILAQLKSPYVVRYYDSFIEENSLHIVMEFCNRGDLQHLIKKAKDKNVQCLKENVIWNITLQIMLGLHYLHKKHILHRDLKSANVFLMKDETKSHYLVKIGDLGVAKLMDTSTALANTIVGTPYYLSPELCADMPYRDKSDCWALGVICFECATLEHPFEARNQCALIMKIIEAQVKIPAASPISTELRNLILWLLQKDPNTRPSVKEVLNERVVRNMLAENQFEVPEELREAQLTDILSNPNFEKKEKLRKNTSGIQLMNQRQQEERQAAAPTRAQRGGSHGDGLRVGADSAAPTTANANVNAFPKGAVRRAGSNAALASEAKSDQATIVPGLGVAGSGLGSRNTSSQMLAGVGQRASSGTTNLSRGNSGGDSDAGVRGDRVRGPPSHRRVPSDKALNRYQVRPPPVSGGSTSRPTSDSKLDVTDDEYSSADVKNDDSDKRLSGRKADDTEGPTDSPERVVSSRALQRPPDDADEKDYEPDFEEEEPEDQAKEHGQELVEGRNSARGLSASRKASAQELAGGYAAVDNDSQEKAGSSLRRSGSIKIDFDDDDAKATGFPQHFRNTSHDPFHATDASSLPDPHMFSGAMNTLGGEGGNDVWDPVWTQGRGVIRGEGVEPGADDLFARPEGILEDAVGEAEGEESPHGNDESDLSSLLDIIEDLKHGAIAIAGESLFWKVYDLCAKYQDRDTDADATRLLVQDLEEIMVQEGCTLETACEVAFKVKKLQAFEFSYRAHLHHREDRG